MPCTKWVVSFTTILLLIGLTSLLAATVNGALGYGYSSITVPIALLMIAGRLLNPALVIVEVAVNLCVLFLARAGARAVWRQVAPIAIGILPGVAIGSVVLASISADWAKLVTYCALLPLILIQAAGLRWPIRHTRAVGAPFGLGIGVLYSMTTISGPPLALYFNNQGMAKDQFKVALALARSIESTTTLIAYAALGVLTRESAGLVPALAPGVLIGLPLGFYLIRKLHSETFRRICMSFDAWLVGFGLSRVVSQLGIVSPLIAFQLLTLTAVIDAVLLKRFFSRPRTPTPEPTPAPVATGYHDPSAVAVPS
ncbi:MAG: sulfite exporter TauE/SafE family protein [Kofleriaceae bacterium]